MDRTEFGEYPRQGWGAGEAKAEVGRDASATHIAVALRATTTLSLA